MTAKHLNTNPHIGWNAAYQENPRIWWYEEPRGIAVCMNVHGSISVGFIKWQELRDALKRKDRPRAGGK